MIPSPFIEADRRQDRLEQCEVEIAELKRVNGLLMESMTLLMRLCNEKMQRGKNEGKKE